MDKISSLSAWQPVALVVEHLTIDQKAVCSIPTESLLAICIDLW